MDVKTCWNSTLELLERPNRSQEFTPESLQNPEYSDHRPLLTTEDESTIVKYVMEVLRPFRYWTLWMSKSHTITLHHVSKVYHDMFNLMDGMMWPLAKETPQRKEDLFFVVTLARQKLWNTSPKWLQQLPCFSFLHISSILSRSCNCSKCGTMEWIFILRARHPRLPNMKRRFWSTWRMNTVRKHWRVLVNTYESLPSSNLVPSATASGSWQSSFDQHDLSSDD